MKNCPVCGIPVEDNQAQCTYCGASVEGGSEVGSASAGGEQEPNPVPIATYGSVEEAEECKAKLEAAGLAAMVDSGAANDVSSQYASAPRRVQLWVRDTDAERAMAILSGDEPEAPPAPLKEANHAAEAEANHELDDRADLGSLAPPEGPTMPAEVVIPGDSVRTLESKLSALMDEHDTPGWTVNPAMHPDVMAFIEDHSANTAFMKRAKALQENRASYYATMRAKEGGVTATEAEADEDKPPEMESAVGSPLDSSSHNPMDSSSHNPMDSSSHNPMDSSSHNPMDSGPPPDPFKERPRSITARGARPTVMRQPRRRRRTLPMILLVLIVVPVTVVVSSSLYFRRIGERKLDEALAAATANGPIGWDDLKQHRTEVDEKANTAGVVRSLAKRLADGKVTPSAASADILRDEPNMPIPGTRLKPLGRGAGRPLLFARNLDPQPGPDGKYPAGRWPDETLDEVLTQKPAFLESAQNVVEVLLIEAALKAQNGQADRAFAHAREALEVGRSVGDDPSPAAQQFRIDCRRRVVASIERILAAGRPSRKDELLRWRQEVLRTQRLLEDELKQPLLSYAARGARAVLNESLDRLATSPANATPAQQAVLFRMVNPDNPVAPAEHWLKVGWIKENHATCLDVLTQLVAISDMPEVEQAKAHRDLEQSPAESEGGTANALSRQMLTDILTLTRDYLVSRAELRLAITGLACERFYVNSQRWPTSLEELATAKSSGGVSFIGEIPIDPFDGQPLRLKPFDGGIAIYSVGPDGKDNQGHFDRADPLKADCDLVFRLWDPAKRMPQN
jgi:hypothetical protein